MSHTLVTLLGRSRVVRDRENAGIGYRQTTYRFPLIE